MSITESEVNSGAVKKSARPLFAAIAHARYIISDNPVTGLSFGIFILLLITAIIGPSIVPHDPLASDTTAALQAPSLRHS